MMNSHGDHADSYGVGERRPDIGEQDKLGIVLVGAAAAAVELKKPVARRSLLFPWLRRRRDEEAVGHPPDCGCDECCG